MTYYWANAIAVDSLGKPTRLFTYTACTSIEHCDRAFTNWERNHGYKLLISWVTAVYKDKSKKIIHKKEYPENFI